MGFLSCDEVNVAGGCVALGEEKGLFLVLIDSDVHDEDGMAEKITLSWVDKDVAGLDFLQWAELHFAREGEGAGYAIKMAEIAVQGFSRDTVPKTCVSSKVLIFVVKSKIKSRTMKLTTEQRSEIISEMASSEAGFNESMRVLLDSFSNRIGRTCVLEQKKMSEIPSRG